MKKIKIHIGRIFRFHGKQYNSVGYFYKLKYDEKAFVANYYCHELYKPGWKIIISIRGRERRNTGLRAEAMKKK